MVLLMDEGIESSRRERVLTGISRPYCTSHVRRPGSEGC